jgi:hypothetical protein
VTLGGQERAEVLANRIVGGTRVESSQEAAQTLLVVDDRRAHVSVSSKQTLDGFVLLFARHCDPPFVSGSLGPDIVADRIR